MTGTTGSSDRLRAALRKTRVDVTPESAFDALLDARLADLEHDVADLAGRVTTLIWLVIGAVLLQLVMRIGGW